MADTGKDAGMEQRRGGIFGRGREEIRPPSPVERSAGAPARGAEGSLPELKLTQAVKSPEPIVKIEPTKPITSEDGIIQPYREYTIALAKDAKEIQILDRQGRKVEGLTNTQTMILDWEHERGNYFTTIAIDRLKATGSYCKGVDQFLPHLRPAVRRFIEQNASNKNETNFPRSPWKLNVEALDQIITKTGEGYVVFLIPGGPFIGFQTKGDQGTELPPRNWKRFDLVDNWANTLPRNFQQEVNNSMLVSKLEASHVEYMENGFSAIALKDKLIVTKRDQGAEKAEFTDRVAGIGNNVSVDPKDKRVIYYCAADNPKTILKLDTAKDPADWQTEAVEIPQQFKNIKNLRLDPTGNFFTFESGGDFVMLSKDTLQEAKRIPKLINAVLDDEGRIRGIDEKGYLVVYNANFQEVAQEADKRRIARIAQGLGADLFKKETTVAPKVEVDKFQHLVPVKTDFETQFDAQLQTTATLEDISNIREALGKLRTRLAGERLPPDQISFITREIEDSIKAKEHVLALPIVNEGLAAFDSKLSGNLTLALVTEAKGDLAKLRSLEGLVDEGTRAQIRTLENKFNQQSTEFYKRESGVIEKEVNDLIAGTRVELEAMTSMPDFADWQEFKLPHRIGGLGALAHNYNEMPEMQGKILAARRQLQELSRDYETRFKEQYAKVREKATDLMTERTGLFKVDMDSFMDRLRGRGFKDRVQAETYISSSEALGVLRTEIEELARQDPDRAKELDKAIKSQIAIVMGEIERGGLSSVAETGAQMERFGDTLFPKWEGKVKEKIKRQVDIIFMPDDRTKGPGITADKILGDIGIAEINSRGILQKRRLYEGAKNEDEWRLGSVAYRGGDVFPSYVTQADYRKIKQDYADWSRGDESSIRKTYNEKRQALHDLYRKRQRKGEREESKKEILAMGWTKQGGDWKNEIETSVDAKWKNQYSRLLADYAKFASEKHISLFNRIDQIKNAPETDVVNGAGYVPEWSSHWVTDEQTEQYLEKMAKTLKMQLDLQEGLLDLKGHAGSGKDVLIKMFANRTNRPYFSTDCSKWTTEFELSEDVMLESKDGASQTVKVPSVVLNSITTPGAIMYFNEISAMPEQAQIFLHGLTDEKRTLTLKTSSGKAIKADKTVLLVSSRNPGYPGTFEPQFATKSRMVGLQVEYPPLLGEKDPNDRNPNAPYSASEALRIARSVDSLADFTYEANPKHNDFVKIWDKYVNGIENDAPDLTTVQRFDLEVVLAMVQFANKLREGFILKFEKARASETRGKLLVDQPITGREMRRMAYFLSKMSPEEKATANPEAVTRSLIEELFLTHIDKKDEKEEIRTAMATWTSSKRPAA